MSPAKSTTKPVFNSRLNIDYKLGFKGLICLIEGNASQSSVGNNKSIGKSTLSRGFEGIYCLGTAAVPSLKVSEQATVLSDKYVMKG